MNTPIIHELTYLTKVINKKAVTHYLFNKDYKIILPIKESQCSMENSKISSVYIHDLNENKYYCNLNLAQKYRVPIFINKDVLFSQGITVSKELILNSLNSI